MGTEGQVELIVWREGEVVEADAVRRGDVVELQAKDATGTSDRRGPFLVISVSEQGMKFRAIEWIAGGTR